MPLEGRGRTGGVGGGGRLLARSGVCFSLHVGDEDVLRVDCSCRHAVGSSS